MGSGRGKKGNWLKTNRDAPYIPLPPVNLDVNLPLGSEEAGTTHNSGYSPSFSGSGCASLDEHGVRALAASRTNDIKQSQLLGHISRYGTTEDTLPPQALRTSCVHIRRAYVGVVDLRGVLC